jgi:hypothetical protein
VAISLRAPAIILVFGANCTGKSSLGRALAGRLERCAFIEIDELRYKVVGGLVAYSGRDKPWDHPEEYERQARLALRNAVRLARGFAAEGFSSVLDGLERECGPGSGWAESRFHNLDVFHIAVACDEATLTDRWNLGDWPDDTLFKSVLEELTWYRSNGALFDGLVDTTAIDPESAADAITSQLFAGRPGNGAPMAPDL